MDHQVNLAPIGKQEYREVERQVSGFSRAGGPMYAREKGSVFQVENRLSGVREENIRLSDRRGIPEFSGEESGMHDLGTGVEYTRAGTEYTGEGTEYAGGGTEYAGAGADYTGVGTEYTEAGAEFSGAVSEYSDTRTVFTDQGRQGTLLPIIK